MNFKNTSELVTYCLGRFRYLSAAGQVERANSYVAQLPKLEQLGTQAGVTLTLVHTEGSTWKEATCRVI